MNEDLITIQTQKIDRRVSEILRKSLNKIKIDIANNMKNHGRNASGKSVRSLKVNITSTPTYFNGVIEGDESFRYMQRGRGPGGIPVGFTNTIERWIKQKGIPIFLPEGKKPRKDERRAIRDIAGAIAHSIRDNGTMLHREMLFDDIMSSAVETQFTILKREIPKTIGDIVIDTLFE